jgi:hypothetical protein
MRLTNTIRDSFIRAAMDDVPKKDFQEQINKVIVDDAVSQLPPKIRTLFLDKTLSGFVKTEWKYVLNSRFLVPSGGLFSPKQETIEKVRKLESEITSQNEKMRSLRDKLHGCAYAVTTRKALVDLLPEFEKYLPADDASACRTLPVVQNVVSDFVKAGWPKDGKKK